MRNIIVIEVEDTDGNTILTLEAKESDFTIYNYLNCHLVDIVMDAEENKVYRIQLHQNQF